MRSPLKSSPPPPTDEQRAAPEDRVPVLYTAAVIACSFLILGAVLLFATNGLAPAGRMAAGASRPATPPGPGSGSFAQVTSAATPVVLPTMAAPAPPVLAAIPSPAGTPY